MMLALLKKDLLLNRVVIVGNLIAMLGIYVVAVVVTLTSRHPIPARMWFEAFYRASIGSICLTCAMITVYAGCIFAQERRERSANFLAMMPIRRLPVIISKLIATWSPALLFVLVNSVVFMGALILWTLKQPVEPYVYRNTFVSLIQSVIVGGAITLMAFGVAWMCSTFLESPIVSAGIAFGVTLGANVLITMIVMNSELPTLTRDELAWTLCASISSLIGIGTFVLGTLYYLRRISP